MFNWTRLFEGQHWHRINNKRVHTTDHTQQATIDFLRERPKTHPFAATVAFYPPKAVKGRFNPKPTSAHLYSNVTIPGAPDQNASWARLPKKIFDETNHGRKTLYDHFGRHNERYQESMKNMYRLISEVDQASKNIVNELKVQGILNETLVSLTAACTESLFSDDASSHLLLSWCLFCEQ